MSKEVYIPEGYKVTLSNVTLTRSNNNAGPMICEGNNTITLSGTNSVTHGRRCRLSCHLCRSHGQDAHHQGLRTVDGYRQGRCCCHRSR